MITDLTFTQLRDKLKNKELSSLQILRAFKDEYEKDLKHPESSVRPEPNLL